MHTALQGLHGEEVITDDILVYGCGETEEESQKDHNANMQKLLQQARDKNIKLNRKKCRLCLPEIIYMGHCLSKHGHSTDLAKVRVIVDIPTPDSKDSKKGVEHFLGCLQYLLCFLPQLTGISFTTTTNIMVSHLYMTNTTG